MTVTKAACSEATHFLIWFLRLQRQLKLARRNGVKESELYSAHPALVVFLKNRLAALSRCSHTALRILTQNLLSLLCRGAHAFCLQHSYYDEQRCLAYRLRLIWRSRRTATISRSGPSK